MGLDRGLIFIFSFQRTICVKIADSSGLGWGVVRTLDPDYYVRFGAHTTESGDLNTCQDGTPRDLDPSNQRTNYKLSYRGSAKKTLVRFLRIYNKRNIQIQTTQDIHRQVIKKLTRYYTPCTRRTTRQNHKLSLIYHTAVPTAVTRRRHFNNITILLLKRVKPHHVYTEQPKCSKTRASTEHYDCNTKKLTC